METTLNSKKYGEIISRRTKSSFTSNHSFMVNKVITSEEAKIIQEYLGYHPAGYSFTNYKTTQSQTTWECWNSCD